MSKADLILYNAKLPLLPPGSSPDSTALAIGDERILGVGGEVELSAFRGPGTEMLDCRGQVLLPGFIDAHCHPFAMAAALMGADCSALQVKTIAELLQSIGREASKVPSGRLVRGFGYDDLDLEEKRHPTRWELDQVAPHNPVRLDHRTGHAAVLNSTALKLAGIGKDTPDPPEGVIDRDSLTGEPTGLVLELHGYLRERLPAARDENSFRESISRLNTRLLSYGITSVQDAGPGNNLERWQVWGGLTAEGRFGPRVTMMAGADNVDEFVAAGMGWGYGDGRLRLGHVKVMLTLTTGGLYPAPEDLLVSANQAHAAGFPVAIHAVEEEAVKAAAEALLVSQPFVGRVSMAGGRKSSASQPHFAADRIEHCSECPPHLIKLVAQASAMVVTQPGFVYWNGDRYLERVEDSMLPHLYPIGEWISAAIPLAFSSDGPVIDANPWAGIYGAVTRRSAGGKTLPTKTVLSSHSGVDVKTALRTNTEGGAMAEGNSRRKGKLKPGALADLILVDADPTVVSSEELLGIQTKLTMVGGRVVWESKG